MATSEKLPIEAVLIDVTYDADAPMSDEITLRYRTDVNTYTHKFIAYDTAVYGCMNDLVLMDIDTSGKTFLQFLEEDDPTMKSGKFRHMSLFRANKSPIMLSDEENRIGQFAQSFGLWSESVLILAETQKPTIENLKA